MILFYPWQVAKKYYEENTDSQNTKNYQSYLEHEPRITATIDTEILAYKIIMLSAYFY